MTARLTRWLTTLDNFETKMAQLPSVRRYGRLTRATGLVLEATGLQLPLGATCVIERQDGLETREVESEVVGFNGQRLFLINMHHGDRRENAGSTVSGQYLAPVWQGLYPSSVLPLRNVTRRDSCRIGCSVLIVNIGRKK